MTVMSRVIAHVPPEILGIARDRPKLGILLVAIIATLAAGLDPHVFGPSSPSVQAALRTRPQVETVYLLSVVAMAAAFLVGGVIGDLGRRRRVLLVGLGLLAIGETVAMLGEGGPVFPIGRVLAAAGVGLSVPVALAWVAITYDGVARATAIGFTYAAYGGGVGIAATLVNLFAQSIGTWPSFVLAGTAALIALLLARRWLPPVDRPVDAPRLSVVSNVLWAYALLAGTASLIAVGGGFNLTVRLVILATGVAALVAFALVRRRLTRTEDAAIHVRAVTVALFAGVIIAFAQTAPLAQAPIFFQLAKGFSPIWAVLAIVPIIAALVLAGPIAGWLLTRLEPRVLIAGGLATLGFGDLVVALAAPDTGYLFFVVPFLAIGAGFVIGTTIRTAIIFASVPRHLPATAAALNQTSITVGTELGLVVVTSVVARVAIDTFGRSMATALAPADQASAIAKFTDLLNAIGTSSFGTLVGDASPRGLEAAGSAYAAGVSASMAIAGVAALVGAVVCWIGIGRRARLIAVYEHAEQPNSGPPASTSARPEDASYGSQVGGQPALP
jgi:MFS family permease